VGRVLEHPELPQKDVLLFLIEHAPLAWQRDVLSIVRDESIYFAPQGRPRSLMKAGQLLAFDIMTQRALLPSEDDYADHHSGTMAMHGVAESYKLGIELLRDIEQRWNNGRFRQRVRRMRRHGETAALEQAPGLGRQKIFEVARVSTTTSRIIDSFLTRSLRRHNCSPLPTKSKWGSSDRIARFSEIKQRSCSPDEFRQAWIRSRRQLSNRGELLFEAGV